MNTFFRRLCRYFLDGIFVIAPFIITITLVFYPLNVLSRWITVLSDKIFRYFLTNREVSMKSENAVFIFLKRYVREDRMELFAFISSIPYIEIIIAFCLCACFGFFVSGFVIKTGVKLLEGIIIKIPGLNLLYSYVKESTAAFVGKFNRPVLVTVNKALNIQKIGFITQENMYNLRVSVKNKFAVYIPHSYGLSGELSFFNKEDVLVLPISTTEAWKIILSGGIAKSKSMLIPMQHRNGLA